MGEDRISYDLPKTNTREGKGRNSGFGKSSAADILACLRGIGELGKFVLASLSYMS
jgi:hypothetical protein